MEKKEQTSPHGWFVLLLIVFTLCVFLLTMVCAIEQENGMVVKRKKCDLETKTNTTNNPIKILLTTSTPPVAVKMLRSGKTLRRPEKTDLVYGSVKRHLCSLPEEVRSSLFLHGYEVSQFSVGKNFYMYDCNVSATPDYLLTTILMELPEIRVVLKDHPEYSQYYPNLNPYIHAVELVYRWGYDKQTMEPDDYMTLSHMKILMVSWEDNLYRKSYEQVKNSPLHRVQTPTPLRLQKEELHDFLTKCHILDNIAMAFSPPITLQSIQNNTPIL